jgi:hypothetical protein
MERFYSFVKTKIRYRNKKFDDYDYFSTRIKKHSPNFTDDHIQYFWDEIIRVERILRAPILPRIELTNDDNIENTQINVIDDRFIYTEITNEEYRNSGISIAEVKRRIKK